MSWRLVFTKQARKDAKKLVASGLRPKAEALLEILTKDPARSAEIKETISRVEDGIVALKTKEKIALELNVYDGETQKDIAGIMNIPANTASSLIRRAKIKVLEAVME